MKLESLESELSSLKAKSKEKTLIIQKISASYDKNLEIVKKC